MNDLLNLAIKAHGGLERWRQVRSLQAKVTLNGTLWRIKGRPNGLPGVLMRADTRARAMPERYQRLEAGENGVVSTIRIQEVK